MLLNAKTGSPATAAATSASEETRLLQFDRVYTEPGVHPFDQVQWEKRKASITNEKGEVIFEQPDVEVPESWSMLATNVVVSKYFRRSTDGRGREKSVRQLIGRVVDTIHRWGQDGGYFATPEYADTFKAELTHLLVDQKAAFNSPVWFNCGIEPKPQCSACFINSVEDRMEAILDLAKTEGMLFKWGSGTGTNLSPIRSSKELLSGGGEASGPVSFMKGYDAFAGVIKSGGKTRRAAKMVILNAEHPDIVEFIKCKEEEEKKAWALISAGYDPSFNGPAYSSVFFQNSNNSVRVTDEFMQAAVEDRNWSTRAVTTGDVVENHRARDLLQMMAESSHVCGDPGIQFDTTVNDWHTCAGTDRINASNPCSEYMFLDDTACNLASLNLMKFRNGDGRLDVERFKHAVGVMITAQEIIVDNASYPTPAIAENSHHFRPLGLGYANLGALLMSSGLPYDSDAGRAYAGAVTALMHGEAYHTSARIAHDLGPFAKFPLNREPMLRVIRKHRAAAANLPASALPRDLYQAVQDCWSDALCQGERYGYKNSQVTVLAPTGTIGFMMDCDTTGVEPDIALVKYKKLVGGGLLKIVNQTVPEALTRLGYGREEINEIIKYIDENETIEGAPFLKEKDLPVFDCAFKPMNGARSIHYSGHLKMMGAVQPFLSGAISKTVNMPEEASVDQIQEAYIQAWRLGLKALAIYRDGSKRSQPLNTSIKEEGGNGSTRPARLRLPDERQAITHKFSVAGHDGYLTVGMYDDGTPGEIFVVMAKQGSVVSGLMDTVATSISMALQYGVPLRVLVDKFSHSRFEPAGFTNNPQIPIAKSIVDYIFRWLGQKFLTVEDQPQAEKAAPVTSMQMEDMEKQVFQTQADAPPCPECGSIMVRNGACYKCLNCGTTSGCS
ncbi:MAG: vitamin B12-dependent ribonucleotide reductase [Acidobacteriota bacterium]|nr:vitamin B12-dependent ribonucleotide reductase [Acidobacteriota bacterium]